MLLNEFQIAEHPQIGPSLAGGRTDLSVKRRVRALFRKAGVTPIISGDDWLWPESRIEELLEKLCSRSLNEKDRHIYTQGERYPASSERYSKAQKVREKLRLKNIAASSKAP